jgi:hypothetical protein
MTMNQLVLRHLIICILTSQDLKTCATKKPGSFLWTHMCSGANVWLSSPFKSSKEWPFPKEHRLLQPSWETCAETCFTLRGSMSFYEKIKGIIPTTVSQEEATSESWEWQGNVWLSNSALKHTQHQSWDDASRPNLLQSGVPRQGEP